MEGVRSLKIYQLAFRLAVEVYDLSVTLPQQEQRRLADQMQRSSRAVVANLVEAYGHRNYARQFVSKLTIVDAELAETRSWLELANGFRFLRDEQLAPLLDGYAEVGRLLGAMINHPEKYAAPRPRSSNPPKP